MAELLPALEALATLRQHGSEETCRPDPLVREDEHLETEEAKKEAILFRIFDILGQTLGSAPRSLKGLRSLLSFCDLSFLSTHSILLKILQSSKGLKIGITDIFFCILLSCCQQKALSFTFPGPLAKSWHCWGRVPPWCSCCCRVRICEKGKV